MDFPLETTKSNIAEIRLTGRYPERGRVMNSVSEMVVYILKGKTNLRLDNKTLVLHKGSVVLVKAKQRYFWTPKPSVTLLIFSNPPWNTAQQKRAV